MFQGQTVYTPYGIGKIIKLRRHDTVVTPLYWLMAGGQKATFYMNNKDVKPFYAVGSAVQTFCGAGEVLGIRDDGIYVVTLKNWKLADGKSPTLYLNEASLSIPIATQAKEEPKQSEDEKCIEEANNLKQLATDYFKNNDYENARMQYLLAVEKLQYVGENLSNDQKAKVFEQSVLINNNISLCCTKLKNFNEASKFAQNGLLLIKTLEERIPHAMVWQSLVSQGMSLDKYNKEWKKKSLFLIGKAEMGLNNWQVALDHLKAALTLIQNDKALTKQADELKTLISQATTKLSAEKKKEKATWSKAFEKGKKEEMYSDPPSASVSPVNIPKKTESNASLNGNSLDIDVDKIIQKATGVKPKTETAKANNKTATDNSALWKPDTFSITLATVIGSIFALVGGYFWWNSYRRRW